MNVILNSRAEDVEDSRRETTTLGIGRVYCHAFFILRLGRSRVISGVT